MDDLISRAGAIARIDKCVTLSGIGCEPVMAIRDVKALISVLPAVDATQVVRCLDCKHRPTDNRDSDDMTGFAIEFPDEKCPCQCEDGWYNWYPGDDWFCANGEREKSDG